MSTKYLVVSPVFLYRDLFLKNYKNKILQGYHDTNHQLAEA